MVSNARDNKPPQPPQPPHEPSLDTLALAEWLAERRAAGDAPPLSALIAALPDAAGDLADATMLDALVAEAEAADPRVGETAAECMAAESTPSALSSGAQRAVADIFGFGVGDADTLAMVAETPATYGATMAADTDADAAVGLLALAHGQGIDEETLAARIMLSPDVLRWLDRVALPRNYQPDALVFHLVGALGVPRERVQDALAVGNAAIDSHIDADADNLADVLTTSASLTLAQLAYWAAQLARQE